MVNLTNFFGRANKSDAVLNNKTIAEGANLVKNTANALNETDAITEGGQAIVDTVKNHKSLIEDITEHFPDFITQNAKNITAKIADTGGKVINTIKENPLAYTAGVAGVAALTAGIVIGRISKSDKSDTDSNGNEALFYIKSSNPL